MAATVFAPFVGACAGVEPPAKAPETCAPLPVTVALLASRRVNPNSQGQPRPVVVRVYQLASDVRLLNAKFDQIWKDDRSVLGDDLVKMNEEDVYPGTRVDVKFARIERVQHVAVVALFQNPQGRSWLSSFELPAAPRAGECTPGITPCEFGDDDCVMRNAEAPLLSVFLDGAELGDGAEHIDQFPAAGLMTEGGR